MPNANYRTDIMANSAVNMNKLAAGYCAHEMKIMPLAFGAGEGIAKKQILGDLDGEDFYKLQAILATSTDSIEHLLSIYVAIGYREPRHESLIGSVRIFPNAGNGITARTVDCWGQFRFSWLSQFSQLKGHYMNGFKDTWRQYIAHDGTAPSFFPDLAFRFKLATPVSSGAQVNVITFVDKY